VTAVLVLVMAVCCDRCPAHVGTRELPVQAIAGTGHCRAVARRDE
jgi:hypothetical protein